MSIFYNEFAIPGRHTINYRIRDGHRGFPARVVEVLASEDEIEQFARDGYLVRENLTPEDEILRLRNALEETLIVENDLENGGGRAFGGTFIRHLMDKHPVFLEFIDFQPTVSVCRALMGPCIAMRGMTARICRAASPNQETEWHFHQRLIPDPIPPLFSRPVTIDCLLYLDDITERNGPLCILPGSHLWMDRDLDSNTFEDYPNQIEFQLSAGSCVLTHGSLWHRAKPTLPGTSDRRLLLFGYGPSWQKESIYGTKPTNGLTKSLLKNADEETLELLGLAGYM